MLVTWHGARVLGLTCVPCAECESWRISDARRPETRPQQIYRVAARVPPRLVAPVRRREEGTFSSHSWVTIRAAVPVAYCAFGCRSHSRDQK
jgi:hypothetical protein